MVRMLAVSENKRLDFWGKVNIYTVGFGAYTSLIP